MILKLFICIEYYKLLMDKIYYTGNDLKYQIFIKLNNYNIEDLSKKGKTRINEE